MGTGLGLCLVGLPVKPGLARLTTGLYSVWTVPVGGGHPTVTPGVSGFWGSPTFPT